MLLKLCQAWSTDHLTRKPVPLSDNFHSIDIFPNLPWCTIPSRSITGAHVEESGTFFSSSLLQEVVALSFLWLDKPGVLSLSSYGIT